MRSYDTARPFSGSRRLNSAHVSRWDQTCQFCGVAIPRGTVHQVRAGCSYAVCAACPYPIERGNYQ